MLLLHPVYNNNNNSAFHNNRINALYISALVMGPITTVYKISNSSSLNLTYGFTDFQLNLDYVSNCDELPMSLVFKD